jgi:D-alanine transfer protein
MLLANGRRRLATHLVALVAAALGTVAFCEGIYVILGDREIAPPVRGRYIAELGEGKEAVENLADIDSALRFGKTLVVLGSSELTMGGMEYIPYHFVPRTLHIPVLAYGRGYFQSFGIYGLLGATVDALSARTRLVLVVSPGWFDQPDIPLDSFVRNFPPPVLALAAENPELRELMHLYVKRHFEQFDRRSRLIDAFAADREDAGASAGANITLWRAALENRFFVARARVLALLSTRGEESASRRIADPPAQDREQWERHAERARDRELSLMRSNSHSVRDDYFAEYLKNMPPEGIDYFHDALDRGAVTDNAEFSMLKKLLLFLQSRGVKALVVMAPLNPLVYKDAARIRPLAQALSTLCEGTGMQYFDMTASEFAPGTLRDGMHLGELGWVRVDRWISTYWQSR